MRDIPAEEVRELVQLYGAGLVTILERLYAADPDAIHELAEDELVGGLMALHDLHPLPLEDRVEAALDECRPYLGSHGGDVTLLGVGDDGVVRLRLEGSCDGCGASQITLRESVEAAILAAAPEVAGIDVDGAVPLGEGHAPPVGGLIPAGAPEDRTTLPLLPGPLRRFVEDRPDRAAGTACELCASSILEHDHRHVVDLETRAMRCSCRACALLFTQPGAAQGQYRAVPEDVLRVDDFTLEPEVWAALAIPVGMAFVVRNSALERHVAFYPSPGGATESQLPLDAWDDVVAANPRLADVAPDVEACLVRVAVGSSPSMAGLLGLEPEQPACYVVPVDRCYELVGLLRLHWRGFDGGQEVREALRSFFDEVAGIARSAS